MSETEYIDLNEFEVDSLIDLSLISLDQNEIEKEATLSDGYIKQHTARHRIEEYFEIRRLDEQISDPILNL